MSLAGPRIGSYKRAKNFVQDLGIRSLVISDKEYWEKAVCKDGAYLDVHLLPNTLC